MKENYEVFDEYYAKFISMVLATIQSAGIPCKMGPDNSLLFNTPEDQIKADEIIKLTAESLVEETLADLRTKRSNLISKCLECAAHKSPLEPEELRICQCDVTDQINNLSAKLPKVGETP